MNNNYKTINELKEIITQIKTYQEDKFRTKLNLSISSVIEYYKSDTFKKKLKLTKSEEKLSLIADIFTNKGLFYNENKELLVFINIFEKKIIKQNKIIDILHTVLHEIRHYHQNNLKHLYNEFENLIIFMEVIINDFNPNFYNKHYNKYYTEIEANNYAINELEKYLDTNNTYTKQYIEYYKKRYTYQLKTYDPEYLFEEFNKAMKKDKYFDISISLNPYFKTFYNPDKTFKTIHEISTTLSSYKIPLNDKIISTIICSNSFLKSINIETLTKEEINFLNTLLLNRYNELLEQSQMSYNYFKEEFETINETFKNNTKDKLNILKLKAINYINEDIDTHLASYKTDKKIYNILNYIEELYHKKSNIQKTK